MASKSRLGRGLGGIIAGGGAKKTAESKPAKPAGFKSAKPSGESKSAPVNTGPYREIPVAAIVPNPYQPRREMDPEHVAELAASIASEGLLQPIVVRKQKEDTFELIAGERRWRAHQKLGLKTIAARVMEASDASSAVISLIENLQREGLNPIEEALGYASLMKDFDLTQEAVSERIGRPRASIANTLRLLALDREIQGYLAKGMLSTGHAKVLLGIEDPAQRVVLARRAIEAGMSVRETERLVRRIKGESSLRSGETRSADEAAETVVRDLEKQISSRLNTKVQLKHTAKKGRLIIEYYGNDDLQRILERTGLQ
ncbi:MAG: ParB/RepB/Spo0J family partition protein [Puniceicoccales bacterium]